MAQRGEVFWTRTCVFFEGTRWNFKLRGETIGLCQLIAPVIVVVVVKVDHLHLQARGARRKVGQLEAGRGGRTMMGDLPSERHLQ